MINETQKALPTTLSPPTTEFGEADTM